MAEIICVGSLTLDLFFQDESLTVEKKRFFLAIGGKYVVNYFSQAIGGGGGNAAVGLVRAGVKSALFTEIGDGGVSRLILDKLTDEGVEVEFLVTRPDLTNVSAILLSINGERTIVNHRSQKSNLDLECHGAKLFEGVKALYLGNMPEVSLAERSRLLKAAHKAELVTYLNLGVKDCRLGLKKLEMVLKECSCLLINRYELADILEIPANEIVPQSINYQKKLFPSGLGTLILTDGEFGSYAQDGEQTYYQPAIKVKRVIDATGAGDAFTSAFIAARHYGLGLEKALLAGARNSASVIQRINAQDGLLSKKELLEEA